MIQTFCPPQETTVINFHFLNLPIVNMFMQQFPQAILVQLKKRGKQTRNRDSSSNQHNKSLRLNNEVEITSAIRNNNKE